MSKTETPSPQPREATPQSDALATTEGSTS